MRLVRWELEGFWLAWYSAGPQFYPWDEIASVSSPSGERLGATILTLNNGAKAALHPHGRNLAPLLAVLESRLGSML